jgi:hypothetical protein
MVLPAVPPELPDDDDRIPGGIEQAVEAFIETLGFVPPDPRALLARICVRVAQRVDETGAMPAAVRELRTMLAQIAEIPNQAPGPVDDVRLQRALRRLDNVLAGL